MNETISGLKKLISKCDTEIKKFMREEKGIRAKWRKMYAVYNKAVDYLASMKTERQLTSQKAARKREIIKEFHEQSPELGIKRDEVREAIIKAQAEKSRLEIALATLVEQARAYQRRDNEIVEQVFFLNDAVVMARDAKDDYLFKHVSPFLIGLDGQLRSQKTFTHSDKTRRVRAMVNAVSRIEADMALEAREWINKFFERIRPSRETNQSTQALFDLLQEILLEKTQFKIGPKLYVFLGLDIDNKVFPELSEAQRILRGSLRSEKTDQYVRLHRRDGLASKWAQVKQS